MSFDLMQINAAIAAHGEAIRVVIADIKGSSPREIGASMLLWPGGQSGSIGGGALEYQTWPAALSAWARAGAMLWWACDAGDRAFHQPG